LEQRNLKWYGDYFEVFGFTEKQIRVFP